MTRDEARKHPDYAEAMQKIRNYRKGFTFTINFSNIPTAKANALRMLLRDANKEGLLESVRFGIALNGDLVEETWRRK